MFGRHQNGFTAVELLITLFIAAAFLMSGYQLYNLIIKDGGETRTQAKASNVIYDYLQRYKSNVASVCAPQAPLTNQSIVVDGLADVTITVTITCPYTNATSVSKIIATIQYGHPQQTISNSTYGTPLVATLACPTGFIPVPGSTTYGTSDFCVMKYEAKNAGGNVPVSTAAGTPFVSVSQIDAALYVPNVVGCTGCHLITEAEWMTIAQNVLNVDSNWSSGTVGTGYIYSGHNDNAPTSALAAVVDDNDGYNGTGNTTGSNQKRTLTLSNGEIIWDFAGNVYEWTADTSTGGQPGITADGFASREYPDVTNPGTLPAPNIFPTATGIANANIWDSTNGIGQIYSSTEETGLHSFVRSGNWNTNYATGVLTLHLGYAPSSPSTFIGFRVAR